MKINTVKYLAVHCSATKPSMDIGRKEIDRWHRDGGMKCIGYHYVIRRNGEVELGRSKEEVGAHVRGYNRESLGICLVGGIDDQGKPEDNFTLDQYVALAEILQELHQEFPEAEIKGHRDFPEVNKACPCFDVKAWWKDTVENTGRTNPVDRCDTPAILKGK